MTPKFAVSYLRVSTRGQAERAGGHDEGFSIPAQREANKKKAQSLGAMVGKEFVDRGASAKSADRPQLQAMLEYVKENADRVGYVIVHKVDRLARNREDDTEIMKVLRECNVQLVSTSESIDETPSGMLLHGIMSSIAEFYSQNLATEVKKGMSEKVKSGGTPARAPLGYKNIRIVDEKGREERTVVLDEERAPLLKMAFEEYATGEWSVRNLAEYLASCGLSSRATPKMPSKPIPHKTLGKILANPYYKGIVTYNGIEYPGSHEPLVDADTWGKIQIILESKINGERTNKHPHFLKGTVYCAYCGSRMIVSNTKKKNGNVYPYFTCSGRHRGVCPDCKSKYVFIPEVERKIEKLYEDIQIPHEIRIAIEKEMQNLIKTEKEKFDLELEGLMGQKRALEHKSEKLLEAHYNEAIPLPLLKEEQEKITKSLTAINNEINRHSMTFDQIHQHLTDALDLLDDSADFYKKANSTIKKMLNQAIFEKIYISCSDDEPLDIEGKFNPPFTILVEPFREELAKMNKSLRLGTDSAMAKMATAKNRILKRIRCGLAVSEESSDIESYPTSNFFTYRSSNKDHLVGLLSRYSNFIPRLISLKPECLNPSNINVFQQVDPEITDISYDPDCVVSEIIQQQKDLSDDEIQQIAQRYTEGASIYELARDFDCHRGTISRHLKQQGITVSNKVTDRPTLVERVLQMYAEGMHGKEIASQIGITPKSVSKILHDNDVRIRHSTEYAKQTSR